MADRLFRAYFYYLTDDCFETSSDILYISEDADAAVLDALDWYAGRQEAVPEVFTPLAAIKVYEVWPQRVINRYLKQNTGAPLFEWKYDWGVPLPQRKEAA